MYRIWGFFLLVSAALGACQQGQEHKVLVFSKTAGYRHASIESGKQALQALAQENGFDVDTTEDAGRFTTRQLKQYSAIIFLNTTRNCLNDQQQLAMQRYIQAGGGFVGIHAAADTEYDWPWYGRLVGAYFNGHPNDPNVREAIIENKATDHPCCAHLPKEWNRSDEWYNYRDIQPDLQVLLNLDESSYEGGTNGKEHPIAWYHDFDGGRAFYTGSGHTSETFQEPPFLKHLLWGIKYAMGNGATALDYDSPTVVPEENRFQKVVLDERLDEPMEMAMLPDGRILFVERKGDIHIYDPNSDSTILVTTLSVHTEFEDGLLGMALDPQFGENHWLYLFYSPPGDEPKQHISRFTLDNDELNLSSEKVLVEIGTQRDECCHSGGSLEFGPQGNLWFSAGDDTNPFKSDGFSPSDERPGRGPWDAQKSSANTQDLRGGIGRITPQNDGTYTIPEGNLFPKDGSEGRPEIFAMGCRNPFRISIDDRTGFLYWGDVGPDAGKDVEGRGPRGHDEVNQARAAGFFGWPYFVGDNKAYHEYDFAAEESLDRYDPKRPINNSPNNTGAQILPPAQPAFIWYPYAASEEFPLVGEGGRNAMAGPVFYRDDYPENEFRYPAYYDEKLFTYDWIRGWIMAVTMSESGDFLSIERFLPSQKFSNPIDMFMSPKGDLYVLEYGTAWFRRNDDARLVHLKYINGNRAPVAAVGADKLAGALPLQVNFSSKGTDDPDGDALSYLWDFGDGSTSSEIEPTHTFETAGDHKVVLTVTDRDKLTSTASLTIRTGNDPPKVAWELNGNRTFYWPGRSIDYEVKVEDKEDGSLVNGIVNEDVAVTLDYLERGADINTIAMGHEALAAAARFENGKQLIDGSDCKACHFEDEESIGPAYLQVAGKYKGDPAAKEYLIDKVLNGGGGVWGDNAMAAHPQLSEEEVGQMIDYILSLGLEEDRGERIAIQGSYKPTSAEATGEEGTYVLMATYTDRGADQASSLTGSAVLTLRHPKLSAASYDVIERATRKEIKQKQADQLRISVGQVVMAADNGWVGYFNYDLTEVAAITLLVASAPNIGEGGSIRLYLDSRHTDPIAEIEIPAMLEPGNKAYTIPIASSGIHNLYFTFDSDTEGAVVGAIVSLTFSSKEVL
ncbi:MAG: PKD domain-containing protein [Saprospiraceae bacterium]|nr:PKD domain-containing protein [Saprospiraceae bacterium]